MTDSFVLYFEPHMHESFVDTKNKIVSNYIKCIKLNKNRISKYYGKTNI